VICLDTNYLIRGLVSGSPEAEKIKSWLQAGIPLCAPSVVWYEFICGPVESKEINIIRRVLTAGIHSFGEIEAAEAAKLFNAVGRVRRLRIDAMIAAAAVTARAELATSNIADFALFEPHGLVLIR
jgi:predicted nucleic acid-binding protein